MSTSSEGPVDNMEDLEEQTDVLEDPEEELQNPGEEIEESEDDEEETEDSYGYTHRGHLQNLVREALSSSLFLLIDLYEVIGFIAILGGNVPSSTVLDYPYVDFERTISLRLNFPRKVFGLVCIRLVKDFFKYLLIKDRKS